MRQIVVSLLLTGFLRMDAAAQAGAKSVKPCELLTAELVRKVSVASGRSVDTATPKEVKLGASGTACEWGDIMLQIDPVTPTRLEEARQSDPKAWESVPGVGDAAWFHNIRDMVGEMFVRVGARTFGVLMEIPAGRTAASFKPSFIAVAMAIVPKLR
jgi:hypothetical protein